MSTRHLTIGSKLPPLVNYNTTNTERELFSELLNLLEVYDKELVKRGTSYFDRENPGMLDLMIWLWVERVELCGASKEDQFVLPRERFVQLHKWRSAIKENTASHGRHFDLDTHVKYMRSRQDGEAQYDFPSTDDV